MTLAFSASQQLTLAVSHQPDRLPDYLDDDRRVIGALLNPRQLQHLGPGRYRYTVTRVQLFQLQIQPVVELQAMHRNGRLELEAVDCHLEGLGMVEDFRLTLVAWLAADPGGLAGEATLSITGSRPPLLKLIPGGVLETTGRTLLSRILLGLKNRVSKKVLVDFQTWCQAS